MHMCWQDEQFRPPMATINNLMTHLLQACSNSVSSDEVPTDFELRWHALQQTKPAVLNLDPSYDLHPSLCFESDFNFVAMRDQVIGSPNLQKLKGLDELEEETRSSPVKTVEGTDENREEFNQWLCGATSVVGGNMNVNFKIGKDDDSIVSRVHFSPHMSMASAAPELFHHATLTTQVSHDTDTDDDVGWKARVEGEFVTRKVREKSKSVQDLMKLTHLDSSPDPDSSDSDSGPPKPGSNLNSLTCASEMMPSCTR